MNRVLPVFLQNETHRQPPIAAIAHPPARHKSITRPRGRYLRTTRARNTPSTFLWGFCFFGKSLAGDLHFVVCVASSGCAAFHGQPRETPIPTSAALIGLVHQPTATANPAWPGRRYEQRQADKRLIGAVRVSNRRCRSHQGSITLTDHPGKHVAGVNHTPRASGLEKARKEVCGSCM